MNDDTNCVLTICDTVPLTVILHMNLRLNLKSKEIHYDAFNIQGFWNV